MDQISARNQKPVPMIPEPVGRLLHAQLIEHLGVELFVIDGAVVVDELPVRNRHADVASAARSVGQRMGVVRR